MRSEIRTLFLALAGLAIPSIGVAQSVDILAQNIDIEFENYGSCPLYLVPGTDDYDLCRDQARQYDWSNRRAVKYEYEDGELMSAPRSAPKPKKYHFDIQEHYRQW